MAIFQQTTYFTRELEYVYHKPGVLCAIFWPVAVILPVPADPHAAPDVQTQAAPRKKPLART